MSEGKNDHSKREADATADDDSHPQRDISHDAKSDTHRRSRKRRGIIALSLLCIIAAIIFIQPLVAELSLSPAQRMLVSANDLGSGWESTDPERWGFSSTGATDSAWIRLGYGVGETYVECNCYLTIFSTLDHANNAYLKVLSNIDRYYSGNLTNISAGDRAAGAQLVSGGQVWMQAMVIQEGNVIVSITMQVLGGNGSIDSTIVNKLAKAQVTKIP
jgi:hypothetical protein